LFLYDTFKHEDRQSKKGGFMVKRLMFLVIILAMVIPVILHADKYTSMKAMMVEFEDYVTYLEDTLEQEIVHMQADIITEDGMTFTRNLYEGWSYGVVAFGDWRVIDLDITLYKDVDNQWIKVKSDDSEDSHSFVTVAPSATGVYMIELLVDTFEEDYTAAHYGMIIYHEIE